MLSFMGKVMPLGRYHSLLVAALRWSLGIVFVWFGALKIFGYNPVYDLIYNSLMPSFASGAGLVGLGVFEVLIGIMLLWNRAILLTHAVLFLHLLGTFSTFLFGWSVIFEPAFPVLSLSGEFVVKNIVLVVAGLVVLSHESQMS